MTPHPYEVDVRNFVSDKLSFDVSGVGLDESLKDVTGMDSLTGLELMAEIEDRYNVYFRDDHLAKPRTLRNILSALDDVGRKKAS